MPKKPLKKKAAFHENSKIIAILIVKYENFIKHNIYFKIIQYCLADGEKKAGLTFHF